MLVSMCADVPSRVHGAQMIDAARAYPTCLPARPIALTARPAQHRAPGRRPHEHSATSRFRQTHRRHRPYRSVRAILSSYPRAVGRGASALLASTHAGRTPVRSLAVEEVLAAGRMPDVWAAGQTKSRTPKYRFGLGRTPNRRKHVVMSIVPSAERPARDSIRRAHLNPSDTREAIFGSFDGMTSTLGVVAGLLATKSNASHIVAGATGIAVAATIGMGPANTSPTTSATCARRWSWPWPP